MSIDTELERECMALLAELDALAARLAELEGQEPTAWMNAKRDMASFIHFHDDDLPLYARPVPAEPVNVEFGMRGENMFFQIGNQSFLLDYKPEEQGEFEFMKAMLLSAFSMITPGVKTEIQPVDARLLNVSTGKLGHINAGLCPDSINGPDSRDPACPACRAIAEADADSKLACALHGTHGAGHETEWVKEQIHRQAESDVLSDLLGSLKEVCETFSSTNRLWKDTAVHVMAQRSIARAESSLSAPQSDALEHVRAEEREACAKACDELFPPPGEQMAVEWAAGTIACANAIRARGQK